MKKLKVLTIVFDTQIKAWEVSSFRSAIIEQTGREYDIFHNHNQSSGSIFRYPLIQYKKINDNPAIMCLGEGTDHIHKFFENKGQVVFINGTEHKIEIKNLNMNQFTMQVWNTQFEYTIENWLALNEENYKNFIKIESLHEKVLFLEKTLTANILAFAKGISWTIEKKIELNILKVSEPKFIKVKDTKLSAFNVVFNTNVFLPNFIGLGKSVSKGFGTVKQRKRDNNEKI